MKAKEKEEPEAGDEKTDAAAPAGDPAAAILNALPGATGPAVPTEAANTPAEDAAKPAGTKPAEPKADSEKAAPTETSTEPAKPAEPAARTDSEQPAKTDAPAEKPETE